MLNEKIKYSIKNIPFSSSLSFKFLINNIKAIAENGSHPLQSYATKTLNDLKKAPEFTKQKVDREALEKYPALLKQMMSFVVNLGSGADEIISVAPPFNPKPFYTSSKFDELFKGEDKKLEIANKSNDDMMFFSIIYQAYLVILHKYYDLDFKADISFINKLTNLTNKNISYYKLFVQPNFANVKTVGKVKKLNQSELKELFDNVADLDLWNEKIPLDKFEFEGFLCLQWFDITNEYLVSQLKSDLLDKNSILTDAGFTKIKERIRTIVGLPELELGLAAFRDFESNSNQQVIWKTILSQSDLACEAYAGTVYEKVYREKTFALIDDLKEMKSDPVVDALVERKYRSYAIIPMLRENELLGMMEFATSKPNQLNHFLLKKLHELFPVFTMALNRAREEVNDRIQAIIQEECTAIHPTVTWRFWDAAVKMLDANAEGERAAMEAIVFEDVVPLYGASDIRNSSIERNIAIQSDLRDHLQLVRNILSETAEKTNIPLVDQLIFEIDEHLKTVNSGLKAGDEVSILEFIQREVEKIFRNIRERAPELTQSVDEYFNALDPELGVVYNKRKDFEDSLTTINQKVGEILDAEQVKAQKVFPHYYEKYRTDGIEYNIYIGQSMVRDISFDPMYVNNLRLWQLLVMAEISKEIREIRPDLSIPLDITQLILVHTNPLSIAFRQDEKKFDVAGAYNIRYEITKKRIDKARIKGTSERITQVGKIAIIYSHQDEITEYYRYINFMIHKGILKDEIEDFELEDLKGASGLRALRVAINFDNENDFDQVDISEIEKVIADKK